MHRCQPRRPSLQFVFVFIFVLFNLLTLFAIQTVSGVALAQTVPTPTPLPNPIVLDTPTAQPTSTATATVSPPAATPQLVTSESTPTPSVTPSPTPQATATPPRIPQLLISEFLADPQAVSDNVGEWLEIVNIDTVAVNLRNWVLADLGSDRHTIAQDLVIQPGQYLVFARSVDSAINGGVHASYAYTNLTLANGQDELHLLAPDGTEIDRVGWGDGTALTMHSGRSWQRSAPSPTAPWIESTISWTGGNGDHGTPGLPYSQPPATITVTVDTTPSATGTPSPPPDGGWPLGTESSVLQIDEVAYSGSDEEFIVLINSSTAPVALDGWLIGDEETPGQGEGLYALPTQTLAAGMQFVIARNGAIFRQQWGRGAHAALDDSDPATPMLHRRTDLATGELALNNSGDEVLLLNPAGKVADLVVYGGGVYELFGVTGILDPPGDFTLQRVPGPRFPAEAEQRHRFLYAPAAPFTSISLPATAQDVPTVTLFDSHVALWGSLGAESTFSDSGLAPPHYLHHAAATEGLDFLAIADPAYITPWGDIPASMLAIPSWRWQSETQERAVVYNSQSTQPLPDQETFLAYLHTNKIAAQWQHGALPQMTLLTAMAADDIDIPDDLSRLVRNWRAVGRPLLPAGNSNPNQPGATYHEPRYSGLATIGNDTQSILDALSARRGWVTNQPGLSLAMRILTANNEDHWMGEVMETQNAVTVEIAYHDRSGDLAALVLWQDGAPLRQLDLPAGNQQWTITVPALPDTFLYAVATQADGDFALTAPVYVLPAGDGRVVLNEILPAPWADYNGDGERNTDDEFIELFNPSTSPLGLAGYQLVDESADNGNGRAFTLQARHVIAGGSHLVLYRSETYLSLNNDAEYVRLLDPAGNEVDRIAWQVNPGQGSTLGRLPDGNAWQRTSATPGYANQAFSEALIPPYQENKNGSGSGESTQNKRDDRDDKADNQNHLPPPVQLDPRHGQAGGPPASVAQSKLAGLDADVEFYAVVIAPPGLFNASIYVADPAPDPQNGPFAGIGINVYLRRAEYPALQEGDRIRVRGTLKSFRGELELEVTDVTTIWRISAGTPLSPLPINASEVGESLEGRLVTFRGVVNGWQGDSIYLTDPDAPDTPAVRVTVRSSTGWRRPYVNRGEVWEVTGVVSQFAWEAPWNGGYRVLVRYPKDLVEIEQGP